MTGKSPMDFLRSLLPHPDEKAYTQHSDAGIERAPRASDSEVKRAPEVKATGVEKTPMASDAGIERVKHVTHSSSDPIHAHGEKMRNHIAKMKAFLRSEFDTEVADKDVEELLSKFREIESRKNK